MCQGMLSKKMDFEAIELPSNTTHAMNVTLNLNNQTILPVAVLAEEFLEYKISIYILTYLTVPVAIWGWIGNFLSFR